MRSWIRSSPLSDNASNDHRPAADEPTSRAWEELYRHEAALGLNRFLRHIARLVEPLDQKRHTLHWDARPAARAALEVAALSCLDREDPEGWSFSPRP